MARETHERARDMAKVDEAENPNKRLIRSDYYIDRKAKKLVATTRSKWAVNAVPRAIFHMQTNEYGANLCEVYDLDNGDVHAVIVSHLDHGNRKIEIAFKREVDPATMGPQHEDK